MKLASLITATAGFLLAINSGMWFQATNIMLPGLWSMLGGTIMLGAALAFAELGGER